MRSLSILLCGYGWFAGIPEGETNNAELIARALDGETLTRGDVCAKIHGMTMPVLWNGAFEPVQKAIDELHPDIVLALGTDGRASAMRPRPAGKQPANTSSASSRTSFRVFSARCSVVNDVRTELDAMRVHHFRMSRLVTGLPFLRSTSSSSPTGAAPPSLPAGPRR